MIRLRVRSRSICQLHFGRFLALVLFALLGGALANAQVAPIAFIQRNYSAPQSSQTTVSVAYTGTQTSGNLNVVVIGWNDSTTQVSSVADSKGNVYKVAVGPTVQSGTATQVIYYASNIAAATANANTVTVTFNTGARYADIRIAEYSGINPATPVDVVAAGQGNGTSSSSGSVTTTNANDLLVGANIVQMGTMGAGSGYANRVITSPDGDILEDQAVTVTGSYSATASLTSGAWIMQMVAFRAASSGGGTSPTITSLNPTSGTVGTSVTISGSNFGSSQGTSTVKFNGTTAVPTSWSNTSIVAPVPSGATTGNVVVTVSGTASNGVGFTVTSSAPTITSLNPTSGPVGGSVTISGSNFGSSQGSSTVTFNGTTAVPTSWSSTSIVAPVPSGATTGSVVVTVSGTASNGVGFTVTSSAPTITSLNPTSGPVGGSVTISGSNFGSSQGTSTVKFNGTTAVPTSWSNTSIVAPVPSGATTGNVVVTVSGTASNSVGFTVTSSSTFTPIRMKAGSAYTDSQGNLWAADAAYCSGGSTYSTTHAITSALPGSSDSALYQSERYNNPNCSFAAPAGTYIVSLKFAENYWTSSGKRLFNVTINGTTVLSSFDIFAAAGGQYIAIDKTFTVTSNGSPIAINFVNGSADNAKYDAIQIVQQSGPPPTDTTPPTVSITSPASGTTVLGTVSVTANASDNVAVASVQFRVDGNNVGSPDTTAPYTYSLNTTTLSNASHTLTAVATDTSNNSATSSVVSVTVNNNNADTTPPTVSITSPASGATVSGTVSVTVNASDNVAVASVQFRVDGNNVGSPDTTAPFTYSLNTTTLSNASHTLTAVATDTSNNSTTSAGVSVTVNNAVSSGATGPLVQSSSNPHYFVNPAGQGVLLSGSETWNDMQDTDMSSSPAAVDFTAYVNFLKSHGHNVTIVWHKDLPTYCNWGPGGTWTMSPFPWLRTGAGNASDGKPQFDLTKLDQTYFDRLLARVSQLQQNGIYAIVELFDGLGLSNNRCTADGYPFTAGNNVNGVDDGGGTNSMTMSGANTITGYQDAYVKKVIDTLNSQPNVLWEISEEAPDNSTWWEGHMISLIRSYEGAKPVQHPIGFPSLNVSGSSDSTLYNSNADWVAPFARISPTSSCGSGTPACKVNINDSDHSYFGMWNDSAQVNRNYLWENFANGDSVMFMDPYLIEWPSGNRNLCSNPIKNGVCSGVDTRWNNFRDNMGYMLSYANTKLDLVKMTPQGNLCSTGYCLADNVAAGAEYLVYAPNGGSFTVNLSVTTHVLNVEWLNPSSGAISSGPLVTGGATRTFTPPFSGDAVLYLVDVNGHN